MISNRGDSSTRQLFIQSVTIAVRGRVAELVEGARFEIVFGVKTNVGSNPTSSASALFF